jgi:hypothetical protein
MRIIEMKLTTPTTMVLFGAGAGMAFLLSASPAIATETTSLDEGYGVLLDFALGGMLFLSAIASVAALAKATRDIEVFQEPAFPAMIEP